MPASSSAAPAEFRIPQFEVQRLQLDGPGDPFPVAEEVQAERQQTMKAVNLCLRKENAESTIKAYESLIAQEVGQAQQALDTLLLPLDVEDKFLALFGWILKNNAEIKWSRIRSLRSALMKYHVRRGEPCILDEWSPKMAALWAGLSKTAKHDGKGKDPIDFGDVVRFLCRTSTDTEPAMQRNRAMIAVSFFGVRRSAETRNFVMADVKQVPNHDFHLNVRCQKNDQEGLGMICVIPDIRALGQNSPARILQKWLETRAAFQKSDNDGEPLFVTVTGRPATIGGSVSADSFRKLVTANFQGNTATHSLRKGGARFYSAAESPEQATMFQGGWRTAETMRTIYTSLTTPEVHNAIHKAANVGGVQHVLVYLSEQVGLSDGGVGSVDESVIQDYLAIVGDAINVVPWRSLITLRVGIAVKRFTSHSNETVRAKAIGVHCRLRSEFAAHKAQVKS